MTAKRITVIIMVLATTILVGWDVYVAVNKEVGDTISEITLTVSMQVVLLPVAWGALMGHFFSPLKKPLVPWWGSIISLTLVGVAFIAWHLVHVLWWHSLIYAFLQQQPFVSFMTGLVVGILAWTQERTET